MIGQKERLVSISKLVLQGSKQSSTSELEFNNSLQSHVYVDWNGPTEHARQKQELTDSDNDGQLS